VRCVKKIVTELGVYEIAQQGGFRLLERAPGISIDEIKNATAGKLILDVEALEMII
jgi:3-oxoacid CoA-transferase subunit B